MSTEQDRKEPLARVDATGGGSDSPTASTNEALSELRNVVKANGSQKEAARVLGVSPQYLCDILKGRREVGADMAAILGFKRVVQFVPIRRGGQPLCKHCFGYVDERGIGIGQGQDIERRLRAAVASSQQGSDGGL